VLFYKPDKSVNLVNSLNFEIYQLTPFVLDPEISQVELSGQSTTTAYRLNQPF